MTTAQSTLGALDLVLGPPGLVLALVVFTAVFLLGRALARRGRRTKELQRLAGWCLALTAFFALGRLTGWPPALDRPAEVVFGVGLAFVILHGINFFYREVLGALPGRAPVTQIHADLVKFAVLVVYAFGFFKLALDVDVGSLFTSSAILTAVAALSMQDTIGSLIAGLVLQLEKPFKTGDYISVAGQEGQFLESTWRHTIILTPDNNTLLIPNNQITKERLVNLSSPIPQYRLHVTVGVPFEAAPVKVKAALEAVLSRARLVCKDPPPLVRLREFGESKTVYEMLFYVPSFDDAGRGRDEVLSQVWYQFKKDGISMPYPARDIRIQRPAAGKRAAEVAALLRKVPLFAALPPAETELLAAASALVTLAPGDAVVAEGEMGTSLFIILDGHMAVSRDGRELARLGPGDFFGEMALLTGEPRQADVRALTKAQCLEVDREGFRVILENNPDIVSVVRDIFASRSPGPASGSIQRDAGGETLFQRFLKVFTTT